MTNRLERSKFRDVVKNTPLVSMDLIVRNHNNEVLLGLRRNGPAKNMWFVPGGRILKGEKMDSAFQRITRDELGIALDRGIARFLGPHEHFYAENFADEPGFGTHYVVLAYETELPAGHQELPTKQHSDYRWISEAELLGSDEVHPYTKEYFR
jgi:colanic acid biosynthesis protein WcaH